MLLIGKKRVYVGSRIHAQQPCTRTICYYNNSGSKETMLNKAFDDLVEDRQ